MGEWRNWQTRSLEEAVPVKRGGGSSPLSPTKAGMLELVDKQDLKSCPR